MRTSGETALLDAAICRVQAGLDLLGKDGRAEVGAEKGGAKRGFLTGEALYIALHPLLIEHEIALYQGGEEGANGTERHCTRVSHRGQWIEVSYKLTPRDGAQNYGGWRGFARRWGLQDIFGVYARDDTDEARARLEEARRNRPPKAAPGLGETLLDLHEAAPAAFSAKAAGARASYPAGAAREEVERVIGEWFSAQLGGVEGVGHRDALASLVALAKSVRPKTTSATRAAFDEATKRAAGQP